MKKSSALRYYSTVLPKELVMRKGTHMMGASVRWTVDRRQKGRLLSVMLILGFLALSLRTIAQTVGTPWDWGLNDFGQLGNGTNTDSAAPVRVSGLSSVSAIAGGDLHTLALKDDGAVLAWGANEYGQLGNGTNTDSKVPSQVPGLADVTSIAGGYVQSLALKADGTVWAWGNNQNGELGNGTDASWSNVPVQVSNLTHITAIAGGWDFFLALENDGTVWAWGSNYFGQLGNGTNTDSNAPMRVSDLGGIVAIAGGGSQSLALKDDGTLWAWGGLLGDGTWDTSNMPVPVPGLSQIKAIACGWGHSLALKEDGTIWAWGGNEDGELGNGSNTDSSVPVQVSGPATITAIAAGGGHSLALSTDGTAWEWGFSEGQSGSGPWLDSNIPMHIPGLVGVTAVACGRNHALALTAPAIHVIEKMGGLFRISVSGSNLQKGIKVYLNGNSAPWNPTVWKSTTKVVIKGGATLKTAVPKDTPTDFTFVNPDGGTATVTGWSW